MEPSAFYKCLADETRLHLVLLIHSEGELCVCDLMAALEFSQPKISRHLAQLRNCQLLRDERRGQWVYYALHPDLPEWAQALLSTTSNAMTNTLMEFKRKLTAGSCA